MRLGAAFLLLALTAGCASYDGRGLVPGQSSEAEVVALMGPVTERRLAAGGETVLWFSRQPFGGQSYAARIGADGRLVALEQRLTEENIARIERNKWRTEDVRDLLGPPYRIDEFRRMERQIWTYTMLPNPGPIEKRLFVQFSPEGVVREVYYMDDPQAPRFHGGFMRMKQR